MPNCSNRVASLLWLAAVVALPGGQVRAQGITVDGRLSPAQTLAGPNYAVGAGLGRQVGGNLFHSFGAFGLNGGETATFSGPPSVGNVIGRVTGGAASSINGTVRSTIPGANPGFSHQNDTLPVFLRLGVNVAQRNPLVPQQPS